MTYVTTFENKNMLRESTFKEEEKCNHPFLQSLQDINRSTPHCKTSKTLNQANSSWKREADSGR